MFLTDQETEKVLNTINGKAPEDEVLKDMKVFFRNNFSVEILDYITDRLKEGRLRVTFMVWGTESALPFICDNERVYENKIREQFSRTCAKHELNKDYYNPSDYFAVVSDFKPDVEQRLMSRENTKKITEILKKYPEVKRHHFTGPTIFVFYATDKDIAANRESGLTQRIYDEIQTVFDNAAGMSGNKLGDVRFSSLETFEGKYGGNFHGFWLDH